jgi:hypothetical protein
MTFDGECDECDPPERDRPLRTGNKIRLIAVVGMPFGQGVVIDPEVRVPRPPGGSTGRTSTVRCARLRCKCGNIYLARLSDLFRGKPKSCGCAGREPVKRAYAKRNKNGYAVTVHIGWFKSREEAEDVARRSRVVVLPPGASPITGI